MVRKNYVPGEKAGFFHWKCWLSTAEALLFSDDWIDELAHSIRPVFGDLRDLVVDTLHFVGLSRRSRTALIGENLSPRGVISPVRLKGGCFGEVIGI